MNDTDQVGALRDVFSAAFAFLTAPKEQAAARRLELCETLGQLVCALEGLMPDDEAETEASNDDDPDPIPPAPVRLERFIDDAAKGATIIPLRPRLPRRTRPPKGDDR